MLAELEARSRRGPGLYPVREAGDFFRLATLHLGIPGSTSDSLTDWEPTDLQDLASALRILVQEPAEAAVWVNRILLRHGRGELMGLPRDIRREDEGSSAGHLADLLHRDRPLKVRAQALQG
jgi:hypothetical protein